MKEIAPEIDFADSSYISCNSANKELAVFFRSWDNKNITAIFSNTIRFSYSCGSFISGIYEKNKNDAFVLDALSSYYEEIPIDHPFNVFEVIDIEDHVIFKIVAEKVMVIKRESH